MGQKFQATGRIGKGNSTTFYFDSKELLVAKLSTVEGPFLMTIEMMDDASKKQLYHFRNVVVDRFVDLSYEQGQAIRKNEAEEYLLRSVCCLPLERDIATLGKEEMSAVIDRCKAWIDEYFNIKNQ